MRYQLYIDDRPARTFRRKHDAIFAAKVALHRENATETLIFAISAYGDIMGHFTVTKEE